MKKILLSLCAAALLLAGSGCKKTSAADEVVGTWATTSTYYTVTSTNPCQRTSYSTRQNVAVVTKVGDNSVNITVNGYSRLVILGGNVVDENAEGAGVGYYGGSNDTLEWTLTGNNTLDGTIKYRACSDFVVHAVKAN